MQRLEDYYIKSDMENKGDIAGKAGRKQVEKSMGDFLSTHPSTEERVKLVEQFKKYNGV